MKTQEMYEEIARSGNNRAINACLKNFETCSRIHPLTPEDEKIVLLLKSGLN